jgi:hypothetical protein
MLHMLGNPICLTHSTLSTEGPTKSVRTILCKQRKQSGGVPPATNQRPPCSDESRPPLVVLTVLADSKPTRKESHHTLQCPVESESVPKRQVLTDGPLNPGPAHHNLIHRATQAKTHHQSRLKYCYQSKQHPSNSSITQKARLLRLSLPKHLPNLAHAHTTACLHDQLISSILKQVRWAPMTFIVPLRICHELCYH